MRTMTRHAGWLVIYLLLWSSPPAAADLYHWTDAQGVRHFSNTPPPEGADATVLLEEIPYDPETDDKRRAQEDAEEGDERAEDYRVIIGETLRCRDIVRNLLDFARESETTSEVLHIDKLLDETVQLAKNQIRISGINGPSRRSSRPASQSA